MAFIPFGSMTNGGSYFDGSMVMHTDVQIVDYH